MVLSRIPGFHKQSVNERREELCKQGLIETQDIAILESGGLPIDIADTMVENVIGISALPFSVATNFQMNGKDYIVPMCMEEPSVVAAASGAALLVRAGGGFSAEADEPISIAQVQITDIAHTDIARHAILRHKEQLIALGNQLLPSLVARGGGVRDIEVRILSAHRKDNHTVGQGELVVHLLLDTRDAMGANLSNTLAENISEELAKLTGGTIGLRILSNLSDKRCVRIRCHVPVSALETPSFSGEAMRDRIVAASRFASQDPYRAATHNKGIMNGVDAVVLATGNDWRAIEAGAHAFAARSGTYLPLSTWEVGGDGQLVGYLEMPLALGIKGGTLSIRPSTSLALSMLRVKSSSELAALVGCVGLATNLSALRALGGAGIQKAHMPLHQRSQFFNHKR